MSIQKSQFESVEPSAVVGENLFLTCAAPLLALAARVKRLSSAMDPLMLQAYLIRKIHQFELQLQHKNIRAEQILLAKYFISALLDDVIQENWCAQDDLWRAYSLLFYFFQEKNSNERVFILIERLQQEPNVNSALIEFAYIILIYGYQGPLRKQAQGYHYVLEKIDELYQILTQQHAGFRKNLFIY